MSAAVPTKPKPSKRLFAQRKLEPAGEAFFRKLGRLSVGIVGRVAFVACTEYAVPKAHGHPEIAIWKLVMHAMVGLQLPQHGPIQGPVMVTVMHDGIPDKTSQPTRQ